MCTRNRKKILWSGSNILAKDARLKEVSTHNNNTYKTCTESFAVGKVLGAQHTKTPFSKEKLGHFWSFILQGITEEPTKKTSVILEICYKSGAGRQQRAFRNGHFPSCMLPDMCFRICSSLKGELDITGAFQICLECKLPEAKVISFSLAVTVSHKRPRLSI